MSKSITVCVCVEWKHALWEVWQGVTEGNLRWNMRRECEKTFPTARGTGRLRIKDGFIKVTSRCRVVLYQKQKHLQ